MDTAFLIDKESSNLRVGTSSGLSYPSKRMITRLSEINYEPEEI